MVRKSLCLWVEIDLLVADLEDLLAASSVELSWRSESVAMSLVLGLPVLAGG